MKLYGAEDEGARMAGAWKAGPYSVSKTVGTMARRHGEGRPVLGVEDGGPVIGLEDGGSGGGRKAAGARDVVAVVDDPADVLGVERGGVVAVLVGGRVVIVGGLPHERGGGGASGDEGGDGSAAGDEGGGRRLIGRHGGGLGTRTAVAGTMQRQLGGRYAAREKLL